MRRIGLALILLGFASTRADAGGFRHRKGHVEAVPPTPGVPDPRRMVTPNGVVVPAWASRQIANSPVPLQGTSWGRRPWAYALNSGTTTPAAYWARLDQLGYGAGPIPGFTNGPPIGNVPSMPIGPDGGPLARRGFRFPFVPYAPSSLNSD
jgi:hypothetical protein